MIKDIIDILIENNEEKLTKVASRISSETLENFEFPSQEKLAKLKNDQFACIIKEGSDFSRKFPIYNKEITELSIATFLDDVKNLPEEIVKVASSNLIHAAYHYGLDFNSNLISNLVDICNIYGFEKRSNYINIYDIDVKKHIKKAALKKTAEKTYSVYALNDKYPIDTKELLKAAEVYFDKYENDFDISDRITYALNVINQAEKLGYDIQSKKLQKYAHLDDKINPHFKEFLMSRDSKIQPYNFNGDYIKLAEFVGKVPLEKLAEAIAKLDHLYGLDKGYNKVIPDPIITVFGCNFKKQAEKINGKEISLENLRLIPDESLEKFLTKETIDELKSNDGLNVLKSLPEPYIIKILELLP